MLRPRYVFLILFAGLAIWRYIQFGPGDEVLQAIGAPLAVLAVVAILALVMRRPAPPK